MKRAWIRTGAMLAVCLVSASVATPAHAENQLWLEVGAKGEILDELELSYEQQLKSKDRNGQLDRWKHTLALNYEVLDWLELGAGYRITTKPFDEDPGDFCCRHTAYAQAAGALKIKPLKLSLRLRGRGRFEEEEDNEFSGRARFKLSWKALGWLSPYTSTETFWVAGDGHIEKQRLDLGVKLKPHKRARVSVFGRHQFVYDDEDDNVIGLSASYRW